MSDKDVTSELPVRPAATADSHNPVSQIYGGAEAPPTSTEAPLEVDDFGLPVRKPRKPVTLQEDAEREQSVQEESELNSPIQAGGSEVRKEEYISRQKSREGRSGDQDDSASRTREDGEPSAQAQYVSSDESIGRQASVSLPGRTSGNDDQLHSEIRHDLVAESAGSHNAAAASEWSHQQLAPQPEHDRDLTPEKEEWQEMPAYAPYDIYDDDGKLIAREAAYLDEEAAAYGHLGGAGKGYTRVQADEDAQSVTSMDDNTAYLFKEHGTNVADEEDEESRDPLAQMQTTKGLLTEGQRIAYVGVVRLAMVVMQKELDALERTKGARKAIDLVVEAQKMWSQKMMVRLYSHMDIDAAGTAVNTRDPHTVLMLIQNRTDYDRAASRTRCRAWGPYPHINAKFTCEESCRRREHLGAVLQFIATSRLALGEAREQAHDFTLRGTHKHTRTPTLLNRRDRRDAGGPHPLAVA